MKKKDLKKAGFGHTHGNMTNLTAKESVLVTPECSEIQLCNVVRNKLLLIYMVFAQCFKRKKGIIN